MIVFDSADWLIDSLVVGDLMVNCYLVLWKATGDIAVIDPGDEPERILKRVEELRGRVGIIVNTHGHGDHIGGNRTLAKMTGVKIAIGRADAGMLPDAELNLSQAYGMVVTSPLAGILLKEGDTVVVGGGVLKVLETPGHTKGGITLVADGFAVVGDLIFQGSIGRTDFPGGSFEVLMNSINQKVLPLGDKTVLLPGHEDQTTVGLERLYNPFLMMDSPPN